MPKGGIQAGKGKWDNKQKPVNQILKALLKFQWIITKSKEGVGNNFS